MPCLPRIAAALLAVLLLAAPVAAQGWRPAVESQTDAEWLTQLDARLAPVHGMLRDTLEIIGGATLPEQDAYLVIIQAQAAKGILILDAMEPAPACALDYMAIERV